LTVVPVPQGQSKGQKVIGSKQGRIVKLTSEMDFSINFLQNDTSHIEIWPRGYCEISKFENLHWRKKWQKGQKFIATVKGSGYADDIVNFFETADVL